MVTMTGASAAVWRGRRSHGLTGPSGTGRRVRAVSWPCGGPGPGHGACRRNLLRSAAHQPMRPAPNTSGLIGVLNAITAPKITATRDRFTHVADHPGHRHLTVPAVTHHLRGAANLRRGRVARLGHATAWVGRLTVLHRAGGGSWRASDGPGRWAYVIREGLSSAVVAAVPDPTHQGLKRGAGRVIAHRCRLGYSVRFRPSHTGPTTKDRLDRILLGGPVAMCQLLRPRCAEPLEVRERSTTPSTGRSGSRGRFR